MKLNALVGLGLGATLVGGVYYVMTREKKEDDISDKFVDVNDEYNQNLLRAAKMQAIDIINTFKAITPDYAITDFVTRIDSANSVPEVTNIVNQFTKFRFE